MDAREVSPPALDDLFRQRYRIEDLIAHGGMGVVYRGVQLAMSRDVAIKTIRPHADDFDRAAARFRREVEIGKQLRHPNIIELYDFGETDGGLYVVMELLEGADLKRTLARDGPLSLGRSCEIVLQLLDALSETHRCGFIHRDVKPSNIFLTQRGKRADFVKLLDFGVARGADVSDSDLTRHGEVCGTSAYIAPEIFLQGEIGYAADVYAVGLILLECLTGRKVIDGSTPAESLLLHVRSTIEVPDPFAATPVADVIRKAIAKRPDWRYADADEMRDALAAAIGASDANLRLQLPVDTRVDIDVGDLLDDLEELLGSSGALDGPVEGHGSSDILLTSETRQVLTGDELAALLQDRGGAATKRADGSFKRGLLVATTAVVAIAAAVAVGTIPIRDDPEVLDEETRENALATDAGAETEWAETTSGGDGDVGGTFIWVELEVVPRGATVRQNDEIVGTAPVRVGMDSRDEPVTYRISADGYADRHVEVDPSRGSHVVPVKLVKKPSPPPPPPEPDVPDETPDDLDRFAEQPGWDSVEVELFDRDD